ncbi:hypothetical protein B566_EDAN007824 [Ephemera danica]|nr:hypothetical protein B566_EDAN007824 [Ephemera danica]
MKGYASILVSTVLAVAYTSKTCKKTARTISGHPGQSWDAPAGAGCPVPPWSLRTGTKASRATRMTMKIASHCLYDVAARSAGMTRRARSSVHGTDMILDSSVKAFFHTDSLEPPSFGTYVNCLATDRVYNIWTSGTKLGRSRWMWLNGANIGLTDWGQGEPSNPKSEDCVGLFVRNGRDVSWNDSVCSAVEAGFLTGFICERWPVTQ